MIDQKDIKIGTHGERYGNWMSNPFLGMIGGIAAVCAILMILFFAVWRIMIPGVLSAAATAVMIGLFIWFLWMRKQYAYRVPGRHLFL